MALILGLEIGQRSVRGALLKTSLRAVETERYLEVPYLTLSPDAPAEEGVRAAVAELFASLPSAPDGVITAIGGSRVSLRRIKIPEAARKRAQDVLPFELENLLPFPVTEAVVDFQEVETRDGEIDLLAAAVPAVLVGELLGRLSDLGIVPRELAVSSSALDGLLATLNPAPDEAWLLVEVSGDHTDVCVVRNGACELARTLDEGMDNLDSQPQALRQGLIQTVMKFRSDGGPAITNVVVLGEGCAEDPDLASWIGSQLGLPAEVLVLPPAKGSTESPSPSLGKAWALAARTHRRGKRLDFRKGSFSVPRGVNQLREHALLGAMCALALVASYVFSIWAQYRVVSEERDLLAKQLESITQQHFRQPTTSAKRARELLEGMGIGTGPLPKFDAFHTLAAISASVPMGMVHDTRKLEIQLDEFGQTGKFQIDGKLPDLTARDQIADALDANECIGELERGKTSSAPGEARKTYILEGTIGCPGSSPEGKGPGKGKNSKATKRGGKL